MLLPFTAPIVGARFRPPAADVLNNLLGDTELLLVREPANAHDANAIMVMIKFDNIPEPNAFLDAGQEHSDVFSIDELDRFQLGYIPRDKAEMLAPFLDKMGGECKGKLSFTIEGRPQVDMEIDDGVPNEIA